MHFGRWGLVILFSILTVPAGASKKRHFETLEVLIQHCHDGDTCTGQFTKPGSADTEKIKIRFSGIDAPEVRQEMGTQARDALEERIKGQRVRLECLGRSYDRRTCTVFRGDEEINLWMVKQGWAWDSPQYSKGKYAPAQSEAQQAKRGIWSAEGFHAKSPYCFRHQKTKACRISQNFNP